MELLRKMQDKRILLDTKAQGKIAPPPTNPTNPTSAKQEIIETKPKHKKLKEYFETIIEEICDEEE